ncbi:MAG: hypothetical protein B6U89_02740 [Desulfurococcales archaeon ex4484_58]|nr:MAG: hypothetical protein B6U89_02740 [Desulfurococcales archaeon ex4484_58]
MSEDLVEKMRELLNTMRDWERKPVVKSGKIIVELVKLPERRGKTRSRPQHLALMIRREDAFRGLLIVSPEELDDLRRALNVEKLDDIIKALWSIYKERSVEEYEL